MQILIDLNFQKNICAILNIIILSNIFSFRKTKRHIIYNLLYLYLIPLNNILIWFFVRCCLKTNVPKTKTCKPKVECQCTLMYLRNYRKSDLTYQILNGLSWKHQTTNISIFRKNHWKYHVKKHQPLPKKIAFLIMTHTWQILIHFSYQFAELDIYIYSMAFCQTEYCKSNFSWKKDCFFIFRQCLIVNSYGNY